MMKMRKRKRFLIPNPYIPNPYIPNLSVLIDPPEQGDGGRRENHIAYPK
jgi:hypothetical protein